MNKNQNGFSGIQLLVTLAVIALAVGAYVLVKKPVQETTLPSPTVSVALPTSTVKATPKATADAGLKTFSDASYRFTFQYPSSWYPKQDDVSGKISIDTDAKPIYVGLDVPAHPDQVAFGTSVVVEQFPAASLQAFITSQKISNETYVASGYPGLLHRQGQVPGTAGQDSYLGWNNGFGASITLYGSLGTTVDRKAFEQILSTFKFTIPTAGWKTYTSAQLGYEFRYPTTWKLETATHTEAGGLKRTIQVAQVTPPGAQPIQAAFVVEQDYLTLSQVHAQPGTETIVEVSGKTAYQHVQANSPDSLVFVPSAGLHISLHTPSPEMLQILSTFKFTK